MIRLTMYFFMVSSQDSHKNKIDNKLEVFEQRKKVNQYLLLVSVIVLTLIFIIFHT